MELADRDRDAWVALLGRHYANGRFDHEELDRRLEVVLTAATYADVHPVVADLPPRGAGAPDRRRRSKRHGEREAARAGWLPTTERFVDPTTDRVMRRLDRSARARAALRPRAG